MNLSDMKEFSKAFNTRKVENIENLAEKKNSIQQ
jgi:hypothetical protein